jgi:N6-adenosine-specific RNA methylase IME4
VEAITLKETRRLRPHPAATLVPEMAAKDYAELQGDIAKHGVQIALDVDGEVVLDGRHRLRIARTLGLVQVPVRQVLLKGESAVEYLLKMALLRRHLTDDQRAAMAALWKKAHARQVGRPKNNSHNGVGISPSVPAWEVPQLFHITRRKLDEATYLLARSPERLAAVHKGELKLAELKREVHLQEQREGIATLVMPPGLYSVIVVDPPWPYQKRREDVTKRGITPYPALSVEKIKALTLPAAKDCVVWLWTTNAFLHEAYHVLEVWQCQPKTVLTWVKDRMGVGDWLRGKTEHCILAIKGKPVITLKNQTTVLQGKRRGHSAKPEEFFALVESLCPAPQKLEMFAGGKPRPGWKSYGT